MESSKIKSEIVEQHVSNEQMGVKLAATVVWVSLMMMPFVLGIMNEGWLANVLAIAWGMMMLRFAQKFTPRWMRDIIDQIIADDDDVDEA